MDIARRRSAVVSVALAAAVALLAPSPASATHEDPASPNDPLYPHQWGPRQVRAEEGWHRSTGAGTTIAIVDSGIDTDHPDLAAKIVGGYDAIEGGGNGDWRDEDPHGTHVAGIAAAVTDNNEGIVGVARDANLLAVRVLGPDGGSFEDVAEGIRWAVDNGADVINLSLGAPPGVQVLVMTGLLTDVYDAIAYANSQGVVVVAASGNESFPICDEPAFDPGVLCVTATDKREAHTWYSNGGVKPDLLAVAAPGGAGTLVVCGEEILSTVPTGTSFQGCPYETPDYEEQFWFGTSMAAPHASGVAALLVAMGCTREQTLDLMTSTARRPFTGEPRGVWDPLYGYGIVDADASTAAAETTCAGGGTGGETGGETGDNTAPTATNDATQTSGRKPVDIPVLANDSDPDGDALTIIGVTDPAGGEARIEGDVIRYQADRGFDGTDTFQYTIDDGRGGTDTATVSVDVSGGGGGAQEHRDDRRR